MARKVGLMNIYELTGQYKLLENACLLNEDDRALEFELAKIDGALEEKAENYAKLIKNLEAEKAGYENEAKRLSDRAKAIDRNIKSLKANLLWAMKETGKDKIRGKLFTVGVAKNGGKAPLVIDVPAENLPVDLQVVTIEPDKDAIRNYIEETGDFTFAHLEDRGEHLSIR